MGRTLWALLLIAWLRGPALAEPESVPRTHPDPIAIPGTASTPGSQPSPWLDLAPATLLDHPPRHTTHHPIAAVATLAGVYLGFTTWTYFAWYRNVMKNDEDPSKPPFVWGGDGLFGVTEYAGGSDKLGHAWATMTLGRAGTETLVRFGGYDRVASAAIGAGLSELLFFGVEVKDGYYYQFSYGDFAFNTLGALLSFGLSVSPRFDELFDFRVEYWPSHEYRNQFKGGNVNVAEDYSGQIYMAALHLGGFHGLRDARYGGWSRFVDVAIGFGTRGYKPDEPPGTLPEDRYEERQHMYAGLSLNAQGLFDWLLADTRSPVLRTTRKIAHGVFEVFNAPSTFVPLYHDSRAAPPRSVE
ncbi:MAG: DUF2279 domain-containing protein [Deltaproteobacteria bacterium]|nr:DUF2279 domain-containing protein [Deltaproteobacteria bacterium]